MQVGFSYLKSIQVSKNVKLPINIVGCKCKGTCADSRTCACAKLNGSDFPYVHRDGGRFSVLLRRAGLDDYVMYHSQTVKVKKALRLRSQNLTVGLSSALMQVLVEMLPADNIPSLQELTYDYGYILDSVMGLDGNIKRVPCYCGGANCSLY
ncbi:Histone-lysine N-methyltransferase, H3 lysine-9 specific SUVH4 [Linum perenne]